MGSYGELQELWETPDSIVRDQKFMWLKNKLGFPGPIDRLPNHFEWSGVEWSGVANPDFGFCHEFTWLRTPRNGNPVIQDLDLSQNKLSLEQFEEGASGSPKAQAAGSALSNGSASEKMAVWGVKRCHQNKGWSLYSAVVVKTVLGSHFGGLVQLPV